jgi:hypothetical protein
MKIVIPILRENTIKGAKGVKIKIFFPRIAHDTCHLCIGL